MNGLSSINVELTSRCNKSCWMCGRRRIEKAGPTDWGDMPLELVEKIAAQVPPGVFVQLHNNGEPLLYPCLGEAINLFKSRGCYTGLDTNGKLLMEKAYEIEGLDTITISIIPRDPEFKEQYEVVKDFLSLSYRPALVVLRLLGDDQGNDYRAADLERRYGCMIVRRVLHSPDGSHNYEKPVVIPEAGVCLEMLHKLSIDRYGNVSPCVRFDPEGLGILGNIDGKTQMVNGRYPDKREPTLLSSIWNGKKRQHWLNLHLVGKRDEIPFCARCDYWGIPRG